MSTETQSVMSTETQFRIVKNGYGKYLIQYLNDTEWKDLTGRTYVFLCWAEHHLKMVHEQIRINARHAERVFVKAG